MSVGGPLLVLDTATRTPVLGLARENGDLIAHSEWTSRHRHGEELLEHLDQLLASAGVQRTAIGGVVVGTGPGSFTGLRIGLATAKVIAYSLDAPLIGVSTSAAIALAASGARPLTLAVALPAGVADRYVHLVRVADGRAIEVAPPRLVAGDEQLIAAAGQARLVAVDLDAAAVPESARELGRRALDGLAAALAADGARRLAAGERSAPATLVPAYVALPRGVGEVRGEIEWSVDRR